MPARSKVFGLPAELRAELDRRLIEGGFSHYRLLAAWLESQGYEISKSALHHYGSDLEADFERTMGEVKRTQQLAQAFAQSTPDERGALVGATARIASESLLRITMALRSSEEDPAQLAKLMPQIARALGELGRLTISQEKWAQDLREQAAAEARSDAADAAEATAKRNGVTPDGIAALRAAILQAA
jgi:hypothetical protein